MVLRAKVGSAGLVAAALLAGCSDGGGDAEPSVSTSSPTTGGTTSEPSSAASSSPAKTTSAPAGPVKLAVAGDVATGIEVPWGLAFLPDKSALVAERDSGKVKRVAGSSVSDVGTVPGVDPSSEGGLLGLAVDPEYPRRPYVYAYYSSGDDNRIARLTFSNNRISSPQVILDGIPAAAIHNGGRLRFGPDGFLYAGTGDGADRPNSQDDNSLGGKILRITTDGKPAPGNPGEQALVLQGPPQCAGARVRWEPVVRRGVRAEHLGRAERDHRRGELRVARRRGGQQDRRAGGSDRAVEDQ